MGRLRKFDPHPTGPNMVINRPKELAKFKKQVSPAKVLPIPRTSRSIMYSPLGICHARDPPYVVVKHPCEKKVVKLHGGLGYLGVPPRKDETQTMKKKKNPVQRSQ